MRTERGLRVGLPGLRSEGLKVEKSKVRAAVRFEGSSGSERKDLRPSTLRPWTPAGLRVAFGMIPLLMLCGCGTLEFYSQAAAGQAEVLLKRRPIGEVAAGTTDPKLRERLALTRRLLDFAERELKMPSGGAYELYAELDREHLVWVVHAAPELSLEPKRWWYPVVGCQAYRGYFREDLARAEAERLRSDGFETWIGGVDAFSTLGWFRDPVLDTFVDRAEVDYAELIFHELVHRKYYLPGTTDENEALAEAVAREGVRRWFHHTGRPALARKYDDRLGRIAQAREAIVGASDRLRAVYAASTANFAPCAPSGAAA